MRRLFRVVLSIVLVGGYLAFALTLAGAILLNTGTCEMADCEDLKTPIPAIVIVLSAALIPAVLLAAILARWIASPVETRPNGSGQPPARP